jgi:precorrin-8X/cobalt-precorrin-8 methylmutase
VSRASRLFDTYLMVDWSGANVPRTGADSIWLHLLGRRDGGLKPLALDNPATRHSATLLIRSWLQQLRSEGRRVLVGFDFPLGFPAGTAARLGLAGSPWRAMWDRLDAWLDDAPDNASNRFEVAARLNQSLGAEAFPFWGCPANKAGDFIQSRRLRRHAPGDLPEHRACDKRRASLQPVWKLYGNGSVGSQALTGIPRVRFLRDDPELRQVTKIWPFETGFAAPEPETRIVIAEIYPSLIVPAPLQGFPKDAAQVTSIARHFAELDDNELLAFQFAADAGLSAAERRAAEREEGWVLGLKERREDASPAPYLRDAAQIYAQSWKRVRAATDLSAVPDELREMAIRFVHTAGDPGVIDGLVASDGAVEIARRALDAGAPILVDAEMVAAGITKKFLAHDNRIVCTLNDAQAPDLAERLGTTRSAAAVELWRPLLEGAVVAIGNAPTALFHLLEMIAAGGPRPAVILGFPVGFVGAAESKEQLRAQHDVPYVTLLGARGGSAIAAASINALTAPQRVDA